MTTEEFKIKYPHYAHLEGDELWDKITLVLLESDNVLHADPNREIIYHDPVTINGMEWLVENDSKTRWLNNKGEEVKLKECNRNGIKRDGESCTLNNNCTYPKCLAPTESYRMEIIDFSKL